MARAGSLHIVHVNARYLLYFAPYDGQLDTLPQRTCSGTDELERVLSGLRIDELASMRAIAEVQRDSARIIPDVETTDAELRELGFS